jgi:hypothetical protein
LDAKSFLMGLSDEGLILVLVFTWIPVVLVHGIVVQRAWRIGSASSLSEYNRNLVALVTFVLVIGVYTVGSTVSIYAALQDRETDRSTIAVVAEAVWLISPVIGTASALVSRHSWLWPGCFKIVPSTTSEWKLATKRALIFGIPFCFLFAAGDQVLRKSIALLVTGDANHPIPVKGEFLNAIAETFGYTGDSKLAAGIIAYVSNFSFGPFVDLFAPASDSIVEFNNAAGTGISSYFLYAIPEEIGWTGTLYPLLLNHFSEQRNSRWVMGKSILLTGVIWGLWHVPFIVLKADPDQPTYLGMIYNFFFLLSCVATQAVLVALTWPGMRHVSHLLEPTADAGMRPQSLFPAIFAHAAMNVWWNFFNCLYDWKAAPVWSICTASEYSVLAVVWQFAIALFMVRASWKRRAVTSPQAVRS